LVFGDVKVIVLKLLTGDDVLKEAPVMGFQDPYNDSEDDETPAVGVGGGAPPT
jgi:hypothetical protein